MYDRYNFPVFDHSLVTDFILHMEYSGILSVIDSVDVKVESFIVLKVLLIVSFRPPSYKAIIRLMSFT